MAKKIELNFELHPRQMTAQTSFATEKLYGGAAGGGKSHWERVSSIALCFQVPGLQYYIFRRHFSDLIKSYVEGPTGYNQMLGDLIREGAVDSVAKEIRFPNGSKIYLCHCQHEKDVFNFNSFEFHVLNIAEAGQFTPFMIKYLRSRVRMPQEFKQTLPKSFIVPRQFWRDQTKPEYSLPRVVYTCNPDGPGKLFLKKNFIDNRKPDEIWRASDEDGGMLRQFIPARLNDNPSLDPVSYAASLKGIGSAGYIEALLQGRWDATVGAFFPQIDKSVHLIKAFKIPQYFPRFMAYDHGACGEGDPFSAGWYTIHSGEFPLTSAITGDRIMAAKNSIICYRRWNGSGLPKTNAIEISNGFKERERDESLLFRVAGGDIVEQRGIATPDPLTQKAKGESVFTLFKKQGIHFIMADRRRQNGWAQIDYRLDGENGFPLAYWVEECEEDLDTIGALQHDLNDPADIAKGDDHDADRTRYAFMTRPVAKESEQVAAVNYQSKKRTPTASELVTSLEETNQMSVYVKCK